ncbi:hypothetical protein E0Z10_g5831 [Xylaria hypoxylon]|uniref:CRIB domain-containing protein n=1 Tax=Xylaria hypoxylon TaxID=37992 RepID=A0A4Z0YHM5_9PEZI|nr:hypothetical protein E0Z10_g5831 [Xylaria hypoxylon]
MDMFSSSSTSANFKGLRRKVANDGSLSTLHMTRPSTATSTDHYHSHSITDLLEPALDGPPSPEGIRAFSRRIKRGSIAEQQLNETATSSGSSSLRSETPETPWERGLENTSLSRSPSQRSSAMAFKERPDSVQLFSKTVFGRRSKLRREQSGQGPATSPLLSLSEIPTDDAPVLSREQRFIQSMFTRRRARGVSEASMRKYQISGPYDFQHVSHSSRANAASSDGVNHLETLPDLPGARPRTRTDTSNTSGGLSSQVLDKPLPSPPSSQRDSESFSSRNSIQFSPPRPSRFVPGDAQTSPIPPLRTSSRISVRHDRVDSSSTASIEKPRTNFGHQKTPSFIIPSTDRPWPSPISHASNGYSEEYIASGDEMSPYPFSTTDDTAWPLTSSMSSLPEVPEEEEYHLTAIRSRASVVSNTTSLRGSVSVPHLRRVSLSQATQRPPSNASDTLGRFDLLAAQRALHEYDDEDMSEDDAIRDNWEDDIDYCYDHEAEADCDFAWERLSCDLERENYLHDRPIVGRFAEPGFGSSRPTLANLLSVDVPALSPTSYASGATPYGAATPTSATTHMTSNFSLPRIDSSTQLKRDHDRSGSSASSFQEGQGFCLSPSLLIPNDYHEQMLQYGRGELSSHSSCDELKILQHDDHYLKFDKPKEFLHARSSASTTISTLSEQSATSSRYPSSTFTRLTGSSTSSWQAHAEPLKPVTITLNDKESVVTPTNIVDMAISVEPMADILKQDAVREGHSRAQSDFTLMKAHDTVAPLELNVAKEPSKTHRRARTASRSHANASPQFALFPQIPQRP